MGKVGGKKREKSNFENLIRHSFNESMEAEVNGDFSSVWSYARYSIERVNNLL